MGGPWTNFATHPQIYRFTLQVIDELDKVKNKLDDVLIGKHRKVANPLYVKLSVEREAAKKLLIERTSRANIHTADLESDLERYMGAMGAISAHVGMSKVISDYEDKDLENEEILDDGGHIIIENGDISVISW